MMRKYTMDEIVVDDEQIATTILELPEHECKVHGNIGDATMKIQYEIFDISAASVKGIYCLACFADMLDKSIGQVMLMEDGG